jgi:hypothetical protein
MKMNSLEVMSIVREAKERGLSQDHIQRLQALGARSTLIAALGRIAIARKQVKDSDRKTDQTSLQKGLCIIDSLKTGDCWGLHNAIATSLELNTTSETNDSNNDRDIEGRHEALTLLGLSHTDQVDIADALRIADDRFVRRLYRSAAVAYGLIHLIWPEKNPWTLYNWSRSLEEAHPDLYIRAIKHVTKP